MAQIFWPFDPKQVIEWPGERPAGWAPHIGTDWPVAQGTPLRAAASGVVDIVWNDGYGAWVINIICPDGTVVRNGHLSHMAVKDGQWVNAGDYIGNTGGALGTPGAGLSTGAHFHLEIRTNNGWGSSRGEWYDPRDLTISSFAEDINGTRVCKEEMVMDKEVAAAFAAINKRLDAIGTDVEKTPMRTLAYKVKNKRGKLNNLSTLLKREANDHSWRKRVAANETERWRKLWVILSGKSETPAKSA